MMSGKIAIGPFKQILTMRDLPLKGPIQDKDLEVLNDAGLICDQGVITHVDVFENIQIMQQKDEIELYYMDEPMVAVPGYIDAHTHIAYGGSRVDDFTKRLSGKTYQEIASEGGGIWNSVKATRALDEPTLAELTAGRAEACLSSGITTVEVKSGYGLNIEEELKILRAIKQAAQITVADLIPTCLAAHIKPIDFDGDNAQYLDYLLADLFPQIKRENLCNRADIFVENNAFSIADADRYLASLKKMGFELTIHADQFSTGGSSLAVKHKAISADHLEASGTKEIEILANSQTVATVLPGASIGLGMQFAPARKLLDAGACLAIASDWNPGSAPMGELITCASILATYEKLTMAEVFAGITFRAAHALNLSDVGRLLPGMKADLVVYLTSDYRDILYNQGQVRPIGFFKSGEYFYANMTE